MLKKKTSYKLYFTVYYYHLTMTVMDLKLHIKKISQPGLMPRYIIQYRVNLTKWEARFVLIPVYIYISEMIPLETKDHLEHSKRIFIFAFNSR